VIDAWWRARAHRRRPRRARGVCSRTPPARGGAHRVIGAKQRKETPKRDDTPDPSTPPNEE